MDALENQLKEARFLAEEADKKYDEVQRMDKITWLLFSRFSHWDGCCVEFLMNGMDDDERGICSKWNVS